ncbi:ion transporter [Hydromonas duriensis]|uniref:Voltage-gated potassium channel n=1 Tax=Hydromonas duriensis TaxID=1527608 RepID=A0A4R6Y9C2_9BURK|nr:ion transporter [Hydromonas duriensis]TDR32040.1 voltage-gated potassium channel [Hydromonas duriensis]
MEILNINPDKQIKRIGKPLSGWRLRVYTIIFEADTRAGRIFDLSLLLMIMLSVAVVFAESVKSIDARYGAWFNALEWFFTIVFTIEYILRLTCIRHPIRYANSFFGVVDLLSILPTYLAFFIPGSHMLANIRVLRLLRIFRVLGLSAYVREYYALVTAIRSSGRKIFIFLSFVVILTIIMGTIMYIVEGEESGFSSIPTSIYWAITTMTTVGYGDISPASNLGRFIASIMMLAGWGILAVPTGIVTVEMGNIKRFRQKPTTRTCHECLTEGHLPEAKFCMNCGSELPEYQCDEDDK